MEELFADIYTQNTATINGRKIWHYLVNTSIGQVNIIQYEMPGLEIVTTLFYNNYDKAEKKYELLAKKMLTGKI